MACGWFRSGRARQRAKATPGSSAVRRIPITNASDGVFVNRMYAYWATAWVDGLTATIFAGHVDDHPRFFRVNLITDAVERLGSILPYTGTSEGWYWDADGWIYLCDGPRLRRVHPFNGSDQVVMDISNSHPGCRIWQAHSSGDGRSHSATVEQITDNGPYERIGTVVSRHGDVQFVEAVGDVDESSIDLSGDVVVINEAFHRDKRRVDNRVIDFRSGSDLWIRDEDGAIEHCAMGDGFAIGEDDQIGACVRVNLHDPTDRRALFSTWNMGHVSYRGDRCLVSDGTSIGLVAMDGSGVTPLFDHGMVVRDPDRGYDFQVHANLDPSGRVAAYLSNHGTDRLDVVLAVLP